MISVIVPVRNNPAGIRELLDRLAVQTLPRDCFEVVIGDDGSRPGTLAGAVRRDEWVRVTRGSPQTSYAARNRAARTARGGVLAFCDSDCLPEPTWLEQGLAALKRAEVVAGEVTFVLPDSPTVWSLLTVDMFLDQERNVLFGRGVTANLFVRRGLFDELGGFDEALPSGGDYDFVRRSVELGKSLAYAPTVVVRHPTLDGPWPFLRKVWGTNRWAAVRRARAGEHPDLIGVLSFVPGLGVALARRQALRPVLSLSRGRLAVAGLRPRPWYDLRAMAVLYLLVSYVAGLGRARGWIEGRALRQRDPAATGQSHDSPALDLH